MFLHFFFRFTHDHTAWDGLHFNIQIPLSNANSTYTLELYQALARRMTDMKVGVRSADVRVEKSGKIRTIISTSHWGTRG